ncbi:MAG TPA: hypothetical protein DCM54_06420 [Gammaproteobacteria bacterium]|nr:hypothetical protein [Gammaproteobacteria bacterium]
MAELVVITVNESRNRRLQLYQIASNVSDEKRWAKVVDVPLRPSVLFVDLALIDGHERLITAEPRQVNWFDPETKTE